MIQIKRIYDTPTQTDGMRVLVDRLWPRGLSKQAAAIDLWLKEIAPSPELRIWFNHRPERFRAFSTKYAGELARNPATAQLRELITNNPTITLLYAAKDPALNNAAVLQRYLESEAQDASKT